MLLPNVYEILLTTSHKLYDLLPLQLNFKSWVLRGNDIERFEIEFQWLPLTAACIRFRATLINQKRLTSHTFTTDDIWLQRNGEAINKGSPVAIPADKSAIDEFSVDLYKVYISRDFEYLGELSTENCRELVDEIQMILEKHKKRRIVSTSVNEAWTPFDFQLHPLVIERLLNIAQMIGTARTKQTDMLILRPTLWGVGVDLKMVFSKLRELLSRTS
jgi:hypothetical protein